MPINEGLANLSHAAFMVTVVAYALAVLAFAGDFAFGREVLGKPTPAREPATDRVTVGATAGAPRPFASIAPFPSPVSLLTPPRSHKRQLWPRAPLSSAP